MKRTSKPQPANEQDELRMRKRKAIQSYGLTALEIGKAVGDGATSPKDAIEQLKELSKQLYKDVRRVRVA